MRTFFVAPTVLAAALVSSAALAEEETQPSTITAPAGALELTTGIGYSRGFGNIAKDHAAGVGDLGRSGLATGIGIGYRINPRYMVGIYGQMERFTQGNGAPDGSRVLSAAAGVQGQYHFMPFNRFVPWVGLGAGWRGYWVSNDALATHSLHGLDVLRATFGLDYKIADSWILTPMMGATMTMFLSEQRSNETGFGSIESPRLNTFVFAGMGGRFDIGGTRVSAPQEVASR